MKAHNVMPIIGLIVLALVITMGAVLFPMAMYSADYAASNNTGNKTASTNTTATISVTESLLGWGLGLLLLILTISAIVWKFFVK